MAVQYNFEIEKGSVFYISFEYRDENNNIINLTNYCARMSIQSATDGDNTKLTYITDNINSDYSFTISPDQGLITLQLAASTTEGFDFTSAIYDLDLKLPNSQFVGAGDNITRILYGNIGMVSRNVTQPEPFVCNNLSDPDNCISCE
jgi:hypothetical protein